MGKRKAYDWESIERDYRAGVLSIREIARRHGCSDTAIRKKAKQNGWQRDLVKKVREKVRNKMVRAEVREPNATDDEIVEANAEQVVEVLKLQRRDIAQLRALEDKLINELLGDPTKLYITQYQGEIVEKVVALTVAERAQAANNLANVQHKRIALERQAYNVDGDEGEGDNQPEFSPTERAARLNALLEAGRARRDRSPDRE